jgi:hypothetical protein
VIYKSTVAAVLFTRADPVSTMIGHAFRHQVLRFFDLIAGAD